MHQIGSLICSKHDKLMVKMTILFLLCILTSTATVLFSDPEDRIVEHFIVLLMRDALKRTAVVVEQGGDAIAGLPSLQVRIFGMCFCDQPNPQAAIFFACQL